VVGKITSHLKKEPLEKPGKRLVLGERLEKKSENGPM
jgi:hypothetical protein